MEVFQSLESPAELRKLVDWSEKLTNERIFLLSMIDNASRADIVDRISQFELVVAEVGGGFPLHLCRLMFLHYP